MIRPMPDFAYETALGAPLRRVAGVDEVGRGPLAGPVTAAAVILPARLPDALAATIADSKALSRTAREALAPRLLDIAAVGIGWASVEEVDTLNVLQASFLAMRRAIAALPTPPEALLVDGHLVPPGLPCEAQAVIGGDALCLSVAAASIVAKVARDREMLRLAQAYDGYGWDRNAGYGTREHLAALDRLGPSPHHRRSFAPVRERLAVTA